MKNIFIINPAAGKGNPAELSTLEKSIHTAGLRLNSDIEIYYTKSIGDAEHYVRQTCKDLLNNESGQFEILSSESAKDYKIRFIACGGDGTLNEVVNGAFGFPHVCIGCIPLGTGNDFVRNFPDAPYFKDIEAQLNGIPQKIDLIKYDKIGENAPSRYCINMFNIGFDCNVVDLTAKLKHYPLISGSLAYLLGVAIILLQKKGANLKFEFGSGCLNIDNSPCTEDELHHDEGILLTAIANGCFCGGGVKGVPKASVNDGFIDLIIVENISRIKFISLFKSYSEGIHMEIPGIEKYIHYRRCKSLTVTPNHDNMRLCTDGEISNAGSVRFESAPSAISFSVPYLSAAESLKPCRVPI